MGIDLLTKNTLKISIQRETLLCYLGPRICSIS